MKHVKIYEDFSIKTDIETKLGNCKFKSLITELSIASFADSNFEKIEKIITNELHKIHLPEFLAFKREYKGETITENIESKDDLIFNLTLIAHGNYSDCFQIQERTYKVFAKLNTIKFVKYTSL